METLLEKCKKEFRLGLKADFGGNSEQAKMHYYTAAVWLFEVAEELSKEQDQ
jgi:hypothetical protein